MKKKSLREWKKVLETDLGYISFELKDSINKPALIVLEGPMGSGKTTFAKSFISESETMSPSYSVLSESKNTLHGDFYRIEKQDDIVHLELPLYMETKQFFLAEWGLKYLNTINKELPEDFSCYLLEISVNESIHQDNNDKVVFSRNFNLYEVSDI
jgi:tRNA threonylcarbamoyladenosine biosynthesis protein TsaE